MLKSVGMFLRGGDGKDWTSSRRTLANRYGVSDKIIGNAIHAVKSANGIQNAGSGTEIEVNRDGEVRIKGGDGQIIDDDFGTYVEESRVLQPSSGVTLTGISVEIQPLMILLACGGGAALVLIYVATLPANFATMVMPPFVPLGTTGPVPMA